MNKNISIKRLCACGCIVFVTFASYYFTGLWFELTYELRGVPWASLINGAAPMPFQYFSWATSGSSGYSRS